MFGLDIDLVGGSAQNESFMGLSEAKDCGKMRVLDRLMASWLAHGDKVLLFSHSVRLISCLLSCFCLCCFFKALKNSRHQLHHNIVPWSLSRSPVFIQPLYTLSAFSGPWYLVLFLGIVVILLKIG